jgi:hypothetical protein
VECDIFQVYYGDSYARDLGVQIQRHGKQSKSVTELDSAEKSDMVTKTDSGKFIMYC